MKCLWSVGEVPVGRFGRSRGKEIPPNEDKRSVRGPEQPGIERTAESSPIHPTRCDCLRRVPKAKAMREAEVRRIGEGHGTKVRGT